MFESLQDSLGSALRTLTRTGTLTEGNMRSSLEMVRQALLEADVNVDVVNTFMRGVTEEALGEQVLKNLRPAEMLLGIIHRKLIELMGPVDPSLHLKPFTVLMLCGLQGSGKTTTCGKLAHLVKKRGRKPFLVGADLQRPAAMRQLQVLGEQLDVPSYVDLEAGDPIKVCQKAIAEAKRQGADVVILDTAGRLHIDEELMTQLKLIDRKCEPDQVYLVTDAMTGQDAVNSAKAFNDALELDGLIMTKLDGDARGGAVLSVKSVANVPIKYMGVGEKLENLEEFHAERMAGRILGQGDIATLMETATEKLDKEELAKQEEELARGQFTLENFLAMMKQARRMGPMQKILGMMPGMGAMKDMMGDVDAEKDMDRLQGIINSMTPAERQDPSKVIDQSRRRRIADGAGVQPHEVNELVKQFEPMADIMKKMAGMGVRDRMKAVRELQSSALASPGGRLAKQKQGTGKRLSPKEKAKQKKLREKEERRRRREGR